MSFLVPRWAIAVSLALVPLAALVAVALVVRDVTAEDDLNAVAAGDDPAKWKKRTRLFQQVVVGLDTMLERWDVASQVNREKLAEVSTSVEEVIKMTEVAVTDISASFRVIVSKAHEQTEAATSLLKGEGGAGILSLPGVVAALSHARRTSPTLRGKAVLTSFLCTPPPPPPAGVSVNLPEVGPDVSARERLELHMSDPACGSCHRGMDGIGFSLEKLDWLGRYREQENGHAIDDSSTFPLAGVEVTIQGPAGLGAALAAAPAVGVCLSRQWLRYALGVSESSATQCLVERMARELEQAGLEQMMVTARTSDWFRRGPEVMP
jgi:hypothetical protein